MYKWILLLLGVSQTVLANSPIMFKGEIPVRMEPQHSLKSALSIPEEIYLPVILIPRDRKEYLQKQFAKPNNRILMRSIAEEFPDSIQLGMERTPVLNQGRHGSCVTFAVTAALDAAIGAGDYISQLCNLELGQYLSNHGHTEASGWDGSWANWVFAQIQTYGIVTKNTQKLHSCAGIKKYPAEDKDDRGHPMTIGEFTDKSIDIMSLISIDELLSSSNAMTAAANMEGLFWRVKHELVRGNRVTIAILLDLDRGRVGAVGQHKQPFDTWMLTSDIISDVLNHPTDAGHELVITGYDDNAEAIDNEGHVSRGLFTLRNSWSNAYGDHGNYYLSYDYFKFLTIELQAVKKKKSSVGFSL